MGRATLDALETLGVQAVRDDVQMIYDRAAFDRLAAELAWYPTIRPLWIVREDQIAWLAPGSWAELSNEPDLGSVSLPFFCASLIRSYQQAEQRGVRLAPGGISNLTERGLAYLAEIIRFVPPGAPVAVHRYPKWPGPAAAHAPFRSRAEEATRLRQIIGNRALWVTEVGYSTASMGRPWWAFWRPDRRWSDEDVARYASWEFEFWENVGAELVCWYQLRDAEPDLAINRFGIQRSNGTLKPVASRFLA
jgi:hypothetical protein